jgi:hypothetical protein
MMHTIDTPPTLKNRFHQKMQSPIEFRSHKKRLAAPPLSDECKSQIPCIGMLFRMIPLRARPPEGAEISDATRSQEAI